jgi:hypothetical protein
VRAALTLAGVAGLLAVAACGKQEATNGAAQQPTSNPVSQPASAPASEAASTAAASPEAAVDAVLGPDGIGPYKLGSSPADAQAAGARLTDTFASPGCPNTADVEIPKGTVAARLYFSAKHGLSAIRVLGDTRTAEGISNDSTMTEVKKAYPKVRNATGAANLDGTNLVPVAGNAKASYRIDGFSGKVDYVYLVLAANDCEL